MPHGCESRHERRVIEQGVRCAREKRGGREEEKHTGRVESRADRLRTVPCRLRGDSDDGRQQNQHAVVLRRCCKAAPDSSDRCAPDRHALGDTSQARPQCTYGQKRRRDVGHAEMRVAHVQIRDRQKPRRQQRHASRKQLPCGAEQHDDSGSAGTCGQRARDEVQNRFERGFGDGRVRDPASNGAFHGEQHGINRCRGVRK